jgi:hypothetical protein
LIDGGLRDFSFLKELCAVLVKKTADHFHVHAGVKRSLRCIGIVSGESMILEFSYRRIVANDEAVKFPFATQHFR